MLLGSERPLCQVHDWALLDLDGVVYVGEGAVPGAVDAVLVAAAAGMGWAAVTNNALRPPDVVAAHLTRLGLPAQVRDIVTSAMAAARVLSGQLSPGARVLVCGGEGLVLALQERGLVAVAAAEGAAETVDAVVSGHDPRTTWTRLAEGTLALHRGVPWVASNTDANAPGSRGLFPAAGAVVSFLSTASGRVPDVVAGKPHPAMHRESILRTGATNPLVVGDRLDTDIAGAARAGVSSLAVLTGVLGVRELILAGPGERPTYVARDLAGITRAHPHPEALGDGSWRVRLATGAVATDGDLQLEGDAGPDGLDLLRAGCSAAWSAMDRGVRVTVTQVQLRHAQPG
jgi:glycerol 3-phosphatase-2